METISYLNIVKICMIFGFFLSLFFWFRLAILKPASSLRNGPFLTTRNEKTVGSITYGIFCLISTVFDMVLIITAISFVIGTTENNPDSIFTLLIVTGLTSRIMSLFYHVGYKNAE